MLSAPLTHFLRTMKHKMLDKKEHNAHTAVFLRVTMRMPAHSLALSSASERLHLHDEELRLVVALPFELEAVAGRLQEGQRWVEQLPLAPDRVRNMRVWLTLSSCAFAASKSHKQKHTLWKTHDDYG